MDTGTTAPVYEAACSATFIFGLTGGVRRDRRTQRGETGSLAEIWRDLATVTLAKLSANGKTFLKLSEIRPEVQKLPTLCQVRSLEELQISSE